MEGVSCPESRMEKSVRADRRNDGVSDGIDREVLMLARTACLFAAAVFLLLGYTGISSHAQTAAPAALTGKVSSAEEGAMEGVVIRAKKGIVTVSVVSNAKGEFSFPPAKLGPGEYGLSIRATGYDLTGPSTVTLASTPVNLDLKLVKTKNIAAQLTNLEWITSVPGTERQKNILSRCVNCHTLERIIDLSLIHI